MTCSALALTQIMDMQHQQVKLSGALNWPHLEKICGKVYGNGPSMLPLTKSDKATAADGRIADSANTPLICAQGDQIGDRKAVLPAAL